jgi:hypothetical protein
MAARLLGPYLLVLALVLPSVSHAHGGDTVRTAAVRTAEGEWEIQPIAAEAFFAATTNVCATADVAHKVRQGQ